VHDCTGDSDVDVVIGTSAYTVWYDNDGANPPFFTFRWVNATVASASSLAQVVTMSDM
jgi:hypothetical protein